MRPLIDWRDLLTRESIPFIERGANVKRGEINIKCPFCGSADPSFHMGLNLDTGWFSCWRNKARHSGKSPLRLLMALLRIPYWKAREIAGLQADFIDPEGFDALAARLLGRASPSDLALVPKRQFLRWPSGFERISNRTRDRRHRAYLEDRGFDFVDDLIEWYDLRMTIRRPAKEDEADFRDRILIPYTIDGDLVTWTGRAIGRSEIRYKDLSPDHSLVPAKETLYNYDCIAKGGRVLVIQEGPFDVLKIDFYGYGVGVRSVGLSTNSINEEQAFMIEEAVGQFDRKLLMMDNATPLGVVDGMRMRQELAFIPDLEVVPVPFGCKDSGALTARQAIAWTDEISTQKGR